MFVGIDEVELEIAALSCSEDVAGSSEFEVFFCDEESVLRLSYDIESLLSDVGEGRCVEEDAEGVILAASDASS